MARKCVIVIPSRYGSTRFPGKSLAMLAGKPLIQWVWEKASRSCLTSLVVVATDDKRIFQAVEKFGGVAMMTRKSHRSGTDRMAEIAETFPADIYVNVQGDEPLLKPTAIDSLITAMLEGPKKSQPVMATLAHRMHDEAEWRDPNVVKVVCDEAGDALYFSRSPIPFARDGFDPKKQKYWRHVGIYAFTRSALRNFVSWKPGRLEKTESLEQVRALENAMNIRVVETRDRAVGVDTPADLKAVEKLLLKKR